MQFYRLYDEDGKEEIYQDDMVDLVIKLCKFTKGVDLFIKVIFFSLYLYMNLLRNEELFQEVITTCMTLYPTSYIHVVEVNLIRKLIF